MTKPNWNSVRLREWQPKVTLDYITGVRVLANGAPEGSRRRVAASAAESHRSILGVDVSGARDWASRALEPRGNEVLEEMLRRSQHRYVPPEYIAIVYEGLGERDRALQWFEKAYAEHSMNGWLLPDPRLDSIRSEPRFKDIMRQMGLPQ